MDSLITTFHIDWKMIIAQLINFVVVFFVLYRYALKPLAKLMEERGTTIEDGLKNADKQKELLALLDLYLSLLNALELPELHFAPAQQMRQALHRG